MTIKDVFKNFGSVIIGGIAKIFSKVIEAKAENIIKAGLFIGTSVVTAIIVIKAMKNKVKAYTDDSNMSTVDRALALNYADRRNREKLDPVMREVKKNLSGKSKKSYKNRIRVERKKFEKALRSLDMLDTRGSYDPSVLNEMEKFEREMAEIERDQQRDTNYERDNFVLRRVWNEC